MAKARKVCTTSDIWSKRGQSFIGVTAHYLDEYRLERFSFLLAFRRAIGRSTYDILGQHLYDIHNEFGLNIDKLTHTVTDGGSNYCKAFRKFEWPIGHQQETTFQPEDDSDEENLYTDSTDEEDDDEDVHIDDDVVACEINLNRIGNEFDDFDEDENINQIECNDIILGTNNILLPKQMRCCSHSLNNITSRDFEKNLPNAAKKALRFCLRKLRRVWGFVCRSPLAKEIVQPICGRMLVIPNDTRCNALYDACRVVLSLRDHVSFELQRLVY